MATRDTQVVDGLTSMEGKFKNKDGLTIFTRQWKSDGQQPKALIFISHGFGEHSDRYSDFLVPGLIAEGFVAFSHDHVGHGKSEGERAQIDTFDTYVRDVLQHIDEMVVKYPSIPVFLFGHSMGGNIAILTAMQRPKLFTGLVLSGPAIVIDPDTDTKCMRCLGTIISWISPSTQVISPIDASLTCRDPKKVLAYRTDPLVWHGGLKAGWGMAITVAMEKIQEHMEEIEWPFLVLHGDADGLCMPEGSIKLEKLAKSKDKSIKMTDQDYQEAGRSFNLAALHCNDHLSEDECDDEDIVRAEDNLLQVINKAAEHSQLYEGYYHEILNEPREYSTVVLNDIKQWLRERMPSK